MQYKPPNLRLLWILLLQATKTGWTALPLHALPQICNKWPYLFMPKPAGQDLRRGVIGDLFERLEELQTASTESIRMLALTAKTDIS